MGDTPGLLLWDLRSSKVERTLPTEGPVLSLDVSEALGGAERVCVVAACLPVVRQIASC
jgi:hypothetical protein